MNGDIWNYFSKPGFLAGVLFGLLAGALPCSCVKDRVEVPAGASEEIVLQVEKGFTVDTKVSEVTSIPSTLYWGATTGGNAAGTADEATKWSCTSGTVSSSQIATGKYQTVSPTKYNYYVSNRSFTVGASTSMSAPANMDVIAGRAAQTPSATPSVVLKHIYARLCKVTITAATGYTISGVSVSVTPKTSGTYNLRTGAWTSTTTGSSMSIANTTPGTKTNDVYLVPGTYTLTASWTATKGNYSETFSNKTYNVTLVEGKKNNISATLGGNASEVVFGVSVTPWATDETSFNWPPPPVYHIEGEYSVSATKKVMFAKGNLQAVIGSGPTDTYNYTASSWKFADHQWDFIGNAAGNTSFAIGSTVDLFGFVGEVATWDTYGLCTNQNEGYFNTYYGTSDICPLKTDWGSIPAVVSSYGTGWRTLTSDEWNYLLSTRETLLKLNGTSNARYTLATINTDGTGINGMILFPEGVTIAAGEVTTWGTINGSSSWGTKCTTAQWTALEAKGCVFLPAGGTRVGKTVYSDCGTYSSCTNDGANSQFRVTFTSSSISPQNSTFRTYGNSVRLVKDCE